MRHLTPEQRTAFRTATVFGHMLNKGRSTAEIMAALELTAEDAHELARILRTATREARAPVDPESTLGRVFAAIGSVPPS